MISLRQRVLWASLMASAAFAASAQPAAPEAAVPQAPAQVAPATTDATSATAAQPGARHADRAAHKKLDPAQRMERMHKRHAERVAQLKGKLQLSAAQEAAWSSYTSAMKPPVRAAGEARPARVDMSQLTTPQRLDRMQARQAERSARFAARAEATRSFYAQLSPEQQKTFDAETLRKAHGLGHGHGGHHRHGGGDKPAPVTRS